MRWSRFGLQQVGHFAGPHRLIGATVIGLFGLALPPQALAQTNLPEIVVTSPSPVAPSSAAAADGSITQPPSGAQSVSPTPGILIVADDAFVPVTVVTEREVLAKQGATITDTLQQKPGIAGSTFGAGANRPIIRGLDNARVRIQENGIGTHDVSTLSEDHAVPIDPNAAERVEVIRGPATLRYGSQAIGGVVSIENDRIPSFVPRNGFSGEIKGGLSSVDRGRDGAFNVTAGAAGFVAHADGFVRRTDDYDTPDGRQLNSFVDNQGFSVGLSRVWANGYIGVAFTRNEAFYGIPGEEAAELRPRIEMEQNKVQAKGEFRFRNAGIEAIRFWFGATDYTHDEVIYEEEEGGDIIGTRFNNRETEGRIEVQHQPIRTSFGELRGAVGLQGGRRKTEGFGVEEPVDGLLDPAKTRTIAGYLFEELRIDRALRLQFAGRIERSTVDGNGIIDFSDVENPATFAGERSFTPISGSIGALYEFAPGIIIRLTGQHMERAPEAQELFSKGVHEATGTFEIGNPFLRKETANSIELGLKKARGRLRFDGSVYYARYNNFIFKQLTGVECGETLATCGAEEEEEHHAEEEAGHEEEEGHGHELDQVAFQQRKATFYGVELAAQFDVGSLWRGTWGIDGQYDFVRARFSGDNVPRIPPHRLGAGLFYRDANLFARVGVLHAFDQNKVNAESSELTTPGYTLVNAEVSYTTKLEQSLSGPATELTIGIKGENLADERILNHSSFKRREDVLLPGASVKVFGKIRFN